jgi:hypothetical protein
VSRPRAEAELNILWRQILNDDPDEPARRSWQKNYNLINTRLLLAGARPILVFAAKSRSRSRYL